MGFTPGEQFRPPCLGKRSTCQKQEGSPARANALKEQKRGNYPLGVKIVFLNFAWFWLLLCGLSIKVFNVFFYVFESCIGEKLKKKTAPPGLGSPSFGVIPIPLSPRCARASFGKRDFQGSGSSEKESLKKSLLCTKGVIFWRVLPFFILWAIWDPSLTGALRVLSLLGPTKGGDPPMTKKLKKGGGTQLPLALSFVPHFPPPAPRSSVVFLGI